jgi:hypothetical protein
MKELVAPILLVVLLVVSIGWIVKAGRKPYVDANGMPHINGYFWYHSKVNGGWTITNRPSDTLTVINPPVITPCDSLRTALFNANYKLTRVKYYLHIAIKHPSQQKFLTSWISRAIK